MARARKKVNRHLKGSGRPPFVPLLVVLLLIAGGLFTLEYVKKKFSGTVGERPPVAERHRMPPREETKPPVQKQATTVAPPHRPAPYPSPRKKASGSGNVAIIIDDMGSSVEELRRLMAIDLPLTFSVIPGLPRMKEVAAEAHERGYQLMVHMPMEPQGYPKQRLEKNGLLLSQSEAEMRQRLNGYFAGLPQAVGANNHMGSRFTEDKAKMGLVLSVLKERGVFFIDSRTSPHSVGYALARDMKIEAGSRDVFLDNVQENGAIRKQLQELAATARKRGSAIGICHPHAATIQTLAAALPVLKAEGINFVFVSELVR